MILRHALLALVLLAGWQCTDAEAASLPPLLRNLARSTGEHRTVAPRLSITRGYAPCRETPPPPDGSIVRTECPALPPKLASSRTLRRVVREVREAGLDPVALHATALVNVSAGGSGSALDSAVAALQTAARLSENRASLLADLAAAFLVLAEARQTPGDLDRALEAAQEAVELDSAHLGGLFNRALALERIGLEVADDAWRAYLRADSTSGWADEVRTYLRDNVTIDVRPPAAATPQSAADFAHRHPQQATAWGWETLLPAWGTAQDSARTAMADSVLRLADAVGRALVAARRDATLADAVATIRATESATRARLARAHQAYGEGQRLYDNGDRPGSRPYFARAARDGAASPALRLWARVRLGAAQAYSRDPVALQTIQSVVTETDSVRYPALAGRARWFMGTTVSFTGAYEQGRHWYLAAGPLLERAGEAEHGFAVRHMAGQTLSLLGDVLAGDREQHSAMVGLRAYTGSVWRHNLLKATAETRRQAGLERAALHYHAEDVRVATRAPRRLYEVEARLARAPLLAAAGRQVEALADMRSARAVIGSLPPFARDFFQNSLRLAEAEVGWRSTPARAALLLEPVIRARQDNPALLLPALLLRANALQASGDTAAARRDLGTATAEMLRQAGVLQAPSLRRSLYRQAQGVLERRILSLVSAGNDRAALEELEYARAAFGRRSVRPERRLRLPPGWTGVSFALVGDTLLTWTVHDGRVELLRRTVGRQALIRAVEHARSSLEMRSDDLEAQRALGDLYDLLIRPLGRRLGPAGAPLAIAADGPLSAIPFAALFDSARSRYMVQDRRLDAVSTLHGAGKAPAPAAAPARVLLVADPAFERSAHPGLNRLSKAADEAASIARLYPEADTIAGDAAQLGRVAAALTRAELVHFAGHAVLDDARPERSFLLLAGRGGRLTADSIGKMDLREVRLVVLSACETARDAGGISGGLAGLAAAFTDAGAEGVLGSLWRVDDSLTHPLMVEFHRAYQASGDAAGALRAAQLQLLRSDNPRLRSPAAWAGFVHVGP